MSIELALIPIAIAVAGMIAARSQHQTGDTSAIRLTTRIRDERLLAAALRSYGCAAVATGDEVSTNFQDRRIVFERMDGSAFDVVFYGDIPIDHATRFVTELHEVYGREVQQQVYQRLRERAALRGMTVESEHVQDDNSIVVTLLVSEAAR